MQINQELRTALLGVFPAEVVEKVEGSGAYAALKFAVGARAKGYGTPAAEVLAAIDADALRTAEAAEDAAAFLAAKVNELPEPL